MTQIHSTNLQFHEFNERSQCSAKCETIETEKSAEIGKNLPQTPRVSQTVVKAKKATNQYISVGDRRDFGPLKSGSY